MPGVIVHGRLIDRHPIISTTDIYISRVVRTNEGVDLDLIIIIFILASISWSRLLGRGCLAGATAFYIDISGDGLPQNKVDIIDSGGAWANELHDPGMGRAAAAAGDLGRLIGVGPRTFDHTLINCLITYHHHSVLLLVLGLDTVGWLVKR